MSEHTARVFWQRNEAVFTDNRYSRAHSWALDGGLTIPASSSPHVVPVPMSDPANIDPEEAFVAALSSCHMLFFLSIAAKRGHVVDEYSDDAVGYVENDGHRLAMTRVVLRPSIRFAGDHVPGRDAIHAIHEAAHEACFLANSVRTNIVIESPD